MEYMYVNPNHSILLKELQIFNELMKKKNTRKWGKRCEGMQLGWHRHVTEKREEDSQRNAGASGLKRFLDISDKKRNNNI